MSADSELEKLRSDSTHEDTLATLRSEPAAVDADLKQLDDPDLGPPGAVLLYRRCYQREREKITLRIDLLRLPRTIEAAEREHELASSPVARRRHEQRCQMIRQGRALGSSKETYLPPYPEVAAKRSLIEASRELRRATLRLQELMRDDAEWVEQLRTIAPPERLASELRAPKSISGGVAPRTASDMEDSSKSTDKRAASGSPLMRRYRSEIKRAVLMQLIHKPDATDLEICRALDADGGIELVKNWKRKPEDRLFVGIYRDPNRRNRIESVISKVRADLSKTGLF